MDMTQVLTAAIEAFATVLTAFVTVAAPLLFMKLQKKWGLEIDAHQRDQLVQAIDNGIAYGAQVVKDQAIPKAQAANAQVAAAKLYVQQTAPEALAHFELPPASALLEKKIISQMPIEAKPSTEGPSQ